LEDKRGEADVLTNIGNLYSELGSFDEAEKLLNQSLTIHKELGNRQFESQAYENLGELYTHMGKYPQAIDYFNQCLKTSREIHFYLNEGFAGEALGILYIDQKMYSAAIDTLRQTAAVFSSHGYTLQMLESQALGLLATVSSGNKQNYLTSFTTIRSSYDSLAGGKNDIRFITTLYRICAEAGDTALTSRYLFQAHDLLLKRAETINKPALKESYLKNIPENVALLQAWDEKQK